MTYTFLAYVTTGSIACGISYYHNSVAHYVRRAQCYYKKEKKDYGVRFSYPDFVLRFKKTILYTQSPMQFDMILQHQAIVEKYFNKRHYWRPVHYYHQIIREIDQDGLGLSNILKDENKYIVDNISKYVLKNKKNAFKTKESAAICLLLREHRMLNNSYSDAEIVRALRSEFPNVEFCGERAHQMQLNNWAAKRKGARVFNMDAQDRELYDNMAHTLLA